MARADGVDDVVLGGVAERGPAVEVEGAEVGLDDARGADVEQREGALHRGDVHRLIVAVEDENARIGHKARLLCGKRARDRGQVVVRQGADVEQQAVVGDARDHRRLAGAQARVERVGRRAARLARSTATAQDHGSHSGSAPPPTAERTAHRRELQRRRAPAAHARGQLLGARFERRLAAWPASPAPGSPAARPSR